MAHREKGLSKACRVKLETPFVGIFVLAPSAERENDQSKCRHTSARDRAETVRTCELCLFDASPRSLERREKGLPKSRVDKTPDISADTAQIPIVFGEAQSLFSANSHDFSASYGEGRGESKVRETAWRRDDDSNCLYIP